MIAQVLRMGENKPFASVNVNPSMVPRKGDYIHIHVDARFGHHLLYTVGSIVHHTCFEFDESGLLKSIVIVIE